MTIEAADSATKDGFRFCVSDAETSCTSGMYRIFGSNTADDVYVAARDSASWIKVSLHESGSWQHGYTSEAESDGYVADNGTRHLEIWPRPAERAPGWTLGMRIIVPNSQLRPPIKGQTPPKHVAVPPSLTTAGVAFDIYLVDKGADEVRFDDAVGVGRMALPGGGYAFVCAQKIELAQEPASVFKLELDEARAQLATVDATVIKTFVPRILLHAVDPEIATMKWVEMAIDLDSEPSNNDE